jgi:hypothetical protein
MTWINIIDKLNKEKHVDALLALIDIVVWSETKNK